MAGVNNTLEEMSPCNTVLLVDDEPLIGEAVRQILLDVEDLQLHYCQDPAMVLDLVEEVKPGVILLDIIMPDIDGITLLRYLRENPLTEALPVVMFSSKEEGQEKAEAFGAGANDYLVKVPDKAELVARLRYHTKYYSNFLQKEAAFKALEASQLQLAENNEKLKEATIRDGLTGLYNRRHFDEQIAIEWAREIREQTAISMIMLDIDFFKRCNDVYGHATGDTCLIKVSKCLKELLHRPADFVARIGGEEFAIVLPSTELAGALQVAETLRQGIEALQIENKGSEIVKVITVSVGVCCVNPQRGDQLEDLLKCADIALYQAKGGGRNRVAAIEFSPQHES
jgi:two-component system chemotaxis family response regulator WspR